MKFIGFLLSAALVFLSGCAAAPQGASAEKPLGDSAAERVSETVYDKNDPGNVIYLAGGCFWGMQKYLQTIPGVERTVVGYANGNWDKDAAPTYKDVLTGQTGLKETVYVEYDPEKVSLDTILFAYFYVIDPTVTNRQGPDIGSQYQTGVYYTNEATKEAVERIAAIERERYSDFCVELEPLEEFYEAEEYHQNYLDKNPKGYCHIGAGQIAWMEQILIDPADYKRPEQSEIKERLTELQYRVTQENDTEEPFNNEFWDFFAPGIYVDIVSGEPLFSSLDKFESPCGWPAFSKGIDMNTFFFALDTSHGMERLEVRSRAANSHLGHVFQGEPTSPTGNRFCINSAALRFVPYEQMDAEGYGYLKFLFAEEDGSYVTITAQQAKEMIDAGGVFVVDVREDSEYRDAHIPGAISLPLSTLNESRANSAFADRDSVLLLYCRSGNRSKTAAERFVEMGYTNVYEFGGILDWPYETVAGAKS